MQELPTIDELLRKAIQQKRLVRLSYKNKMRIVEPHDYGIHKGSVKLLGYQVGGTSSGPLPNWRWMEIDGISELQLLNHRFRGGRAEQAGKHHEWDQVFSRVEPPDKP